MKIEKVKIKEIKLYENNAKIHPDWQVEQIKNSIIEFGFNDPIAIDENNVIIEGHGRYLALKELDYTEVEIIRLDHLTESKKNAYILAHNKLTLNTAFDTDILKYELNKLRTEDFDLRLTGFENYEIEELLSEDEADMSDFFTDENKEANAKPKTCPHCGEEL